MGRIIRFQYLVLVSFIFILFNSCFHSKLLTKTIEPDYLNYDKIKVAINFNNESFKLKGYINLIKDSDLCFRFWGFMGYDVCKGHFSDSFYLDDLINNKSYNNYKPNIENSIGLIIDKKVLISMLYGNIQSFSKFFVDLNSGILSISEITNNSVTFYNSVSKGKIYINYKFKSGVLKNIYLKSDLNGNKLVLNFDIIEISNFRKLCNF
jgi:hypothetical protein